MLILKGNIVYAGELDTLTSIENGYIVCDDSGAIVDVYETLPQIYAGCEITDYGDRLIIPAFCDMHLHAPQYPMLGTGMNVELLEWLNKYAFPTEARFADTSYARAVYKLLARELINNGTTRVVMFSSLHTDATLVLMEELEAAGVTGYVGKVNMDRNSPDYLSESTEESYSETVRFIEESTRFKRIKPIITPRFTPSCTDELMEKLGRLAAQYDLRVQSHLSENKAEMEWVKQLHPDCEYYYQTYEKYGLWKENTVMAHCVHSDERERESMRAHNVYVAHSPDSNTNINSGIAPVRLMLDAGVHVTLASDIAGGAMLPMHKNIVAAINASKHRYLESGKTERFLSVTEGFYLATSAAQPYFGDGAGFAPGAELHAIVLDEAGLPPKNDMSVEVRLERLIYLMGQENIAAVYSAGNRVK